MLRSSSLSALSHRTHSSGAIVTLRPLMASVTWIWQDRREVSRRVIRSFSMSVSSDMAAGNLPTHSGSTYTWQVAQEHIPPQMAVTPSSMSRNGSISTPPAETFSSCSAPSRPTTFNTGMSAPRSLIEALVCRPARRNASAQRRLEHRSRTHLPARPVPQPAKRPVDEYGLLQSPASRLGREAGGRQQPPRATRRRGVVGEQAGDIEKRLGDLRVLPVEQPKRTALEDIGMHQITVNDARCSRPAVQLLQDALQPLQHWLRI